MTTLHFRKSIGRSPLPRSFLLIPLAIALFLWAGPLAAQPVEASRGHDVVNEVYAPSLTAGIYLVNFVFLYMANPDLAAYLPAYKAPIPQPVVDCLEQNPTGCPWADYSRYFDGFRQQGMLLAGSVSGERKMSAPGATQSQTT